MLLWLPHPLHCGCRARAQNAKEDAHWRRLPTPPGQAGVQAVLRCANCAAKAWDEVGVGDGGACVAASEGGMRVPDQSGHVEAGPQEV